ncbi:ABC transporter permease [Streptomyces zhihengii]|uniref:Transport permease protein n=1 Tax=Streptomyces zhihengii TaxID=1818004 RepID=A0ABS2UT99_9ACTN|nr:ABC transporter permease [Streptomyces zhihengii]MBM9620648.1 ABC transporter permease [Streptomyces zhihengii]
MTTSTATVGRLTALGRAEITLLVRNRTALFVALLMPVLMLGAVKSSLDRVDLGGTGLSVAATVITSGIGMALLVVVHMNLVAAYVSRREDLALKRLRTGEASDLEILTGTALPATAVALVQIVVLTVAGVAFFGLGAPARPDLVVAGVLIGLVQMTALAAATAAVTRTVESAQITTLPFFLISSLGSGLFVPVEVLPEGLAAVCERLPMTGVMTLVRSGWLGGVDTGEMVGAAATALAWTVLAVFAVQRWFRWEPRR